MVTNYDGMWFRAVVDTSGTVSPALRTGEGKESVVLLNFQVSRQGQEFQPTSTETR